MRSAHDIVDGCLNASAVHAVGETRMLAMCREVKDAIIAARREAFEAGYRAGWEDGADHQNLPSEWPDIDVALPEALEDAGLEP